MEMPWAKSGNKEGAGPCHLSVLNVLGQTQVPTVEYRELRPVSWDRP